jgi:hypothetical protein
MTSSRRGAHSAQTAGRSDPLKSSRARSSRPSSPSSKCATCCVMRTPARRPCLRSSRTGRTRASRARGAFVASVGFVALGFYRRMTGVGRLSPTIGRGCGRSIWGLPPTSATWCRWLLAVSATSGLSLPSHAHRRSSGRVCRRHTRNDDQTTRQIESRMDPAMKLGSVEFQVGCGA